MALFGSKKDAEFWFKEEAKENKVESHWDEDPCWPVEDWQSEVADGNTRLGYHAWVQNQKDCNVQD